MSVHTMAAIRNARGLTPEQKAILYTVESRGEVFSTADTLRADCGGMSRDRFYRHRNPLIEQGVLQAQRRGTGQTTRYRVDPEAVAALVSNEDAPHVLKTRPSSPQNEDTRPPQNEDTIRLKMRSQREHSSGPRSGPLARELGSSLCDAASARVGLLHIGGPLIVRTLRPNEFNAWDRHEFDFASMTDLERAEWHALIEAEDDLP